MNWTFKGKFIWKFVKNFISTRKYVKKCTKTHVDAAKLKESSLDDFPQIKCINTFHRKEVRWTCAFSDRDQDAFPGIELVFPPTTNQQQQQLLQPRILTTTANRNRNKEKGKTKPLKRHTQMTEVHQSFMSAKGPRKLMMLLLQHYSLLIHQKICPLWSALPPPLPPSPSPSSIDHFIPLYPVYLFLGPIVWVPSVASPFTHPWPIIVPIFNFFLSIPNGFLLWLSWN